MRKYPFVKLLIGMALVALGAPGLSACESADAMHLENFHATEEQGAHAHGNTRTSCHADSVHGNGFADNGKPYPDEDGCCGCHCPDCTLISFHHHFGFLTNFLGGIKAHPSETATLRSHFYFDRHLPEAVDLPIWQPPKW